MSILSKEMSHIRMSSYVVEFVLVKYVMTVNVECRSSAFHHPKYNNSSGLSA